MGDLALQVYGGQTSGFYSAPSQASSSAAAAYGNVAAGAGSSPSWPTILNPLTSPVGISILGAVAAVALLIFIRQSLPA